MSMQPNQDRIKVVGISGSLRPISYTRMAVKIALEGAQEMGVSTHLIDLRSYELVFCKAIENEADLPLDVFKLRDEVASAQGIILGTPDYHGSFSGVIKNALDLMGFKEFESKMIGLVSVGGGNLGGINALNGLRAIGRQLHAWVIPQQASIARASSAFLENERLIDKKLEDRIKNVGRQVAKFAHLHSSKQSLEFLKQWERAPINPGITTE